MKYLFMGAEILAPVTFRNNTTIWTVEKADKSIDRATSNSQRWELDFSLKMSGDEGTFLGNLLYNTLNESGGGLTQMLMPQPVGAYNAATGNHTTWRLSAALSAGDFIGTYSGSFTPSVGLFFRFGNHNKIYCVTAIDSPSSTFAFYPKLRRNVSTNSILYTKDNNCDIRVYLDDTSMSGITYTDGILSGVDKITVIEAI